MAVTYTAVPVASVAAGTLVAGFVGPNNSKTFFPAEYGASVTAGTTTAANVFPAVAAAPVAVTADSPEYDGSSNPNGPFYGGVSFRLTPNPAVPAQAASVMSYYVSGDTLVLVPTGTF